MTTDLRTAAAAALDALECLDAPPSGAIDHYELQRRIEALRAALDAPQPEPVARLRNASFTILSRLQSGTEEVVRLDEAIAAVEQAAAPTQVQPLSDEQILILRKMIDHYGDDPRTECLRPLIGIGQQEKP